MVRPTNKAAMPKFLIASALALGLSACSTAKNEATAQPQAVADGPAVWTLADDDTVMHIFGFAPVLKTGTQWQTETILTAFNAADIVVFEADNSSPEAQAEMQALIPQLGVYTDGSTLSERLSEDERVEVNAVTTGFGAPLQALNQLKPWLASVQLGVLSVSSGQYDLTATPSGVLAEQASEAGKEVRSLEGATDLLKLMAGFPEEEQVGMLVYSARTLRDDPEQQARLANAWLEGDVDAIGTGLHGEDGAWSSEVIYDAMLVKRNEAWTDQIKDMMATDEGTIFVAVGYGHLAGDDSLIGMLEAEGFDVTRE